LEITYGISPASASDIEQVSFAVEKIELEKGDRKAQFGQIFFCMLYW